MVEDKEDEPFDAQEIRFWSVKTMFKFLIIGMPRLLLMIIVLTILFFILALIGKNENLFSRIMQVISLIYLKFNGYKKIDIDEKSKEIINKSDAQIIVCKHGSYIDTAIMVNLFPDAKFIASEYIQRIPFLGKLTARRAIFLKNVFSGNLSNDIEEELKKGTKIIFYSEGLCSNPKYLLKLRSGAFVPNLKILPIHIEYENNNHWINGEQDMINHMLTQISNRKNGVKVRAGNEYIPSEEDKKDIELFKENFRKKYAENFNIKLSEKSYKDHPYFKLKLDEKKDGEKN